MKSRIDSLKILVSLSLVGLLFMFCFKACVPVNWNQESSVEASKLGGNGDSYGGKISAYAFFDSVSPCAERGEDGQTLPNEEIFILNSRSGQLVRRACQDLKVPVSLFAAEMSFLSDGNLLYQEKVFSPYIQQGDFDIVAAKCPPSFLPKISGLRRNLINASQDLTDGSAWFNHLGISVSLEGSLASLFRFRIERPDSANLDYWRRIHQTDFPLDPSSPYVYSFLVQPGSVSEVWFSVYQPQVSALSLIVNMSTGTVTEQEKKGIAQYSTSVRPVASGLFVSVHFVTPDIPAETVIGITPNGILTRSSQVGDYIYATAIQLESVNSFCSPQ